MTPKNYCKLCNQYRDLKLSHIYPKFIIKWLKDTGTGYLRGGQNLNVRVQDGLKTYLLCSECEDRFGKLEKYFAENIFYPVVNDGIADFKYDSRLFKFVISILWRFFHHSMLEEEKGQFSYEKILLAEKEWRDYLLCEDNPPRDFNKLHLLVGVDVVENKSASKIDIPDGIIHYMARYIDAGVTGNCMDCCIAFIKLPRFFFLIPIFGFSDNEMINTEISINEGIYRSNSAIIKDTTIGHLILDRAKQYQEAKKKISPNQRQKMIDVGTKQRKEIEEKDLGRILKYQNDKLHNP